MKQEGSSWDFKREWHHDKGSLLHDIICMANLITDEDGIIIIGVDEEISFIFHRLESYFTADESHDGRVEVYW